MTLRDHWNAAVELQHRAALELEVLSLDEAGWDRFIELMNEISGELQRAADNLRDVGDCVESAEWRAAWGVHCGALLRRKQRAVMLNAACRIEEQQLGAAALLARVPELVNAARRIEEQQPGAVALPARVPELTPC